MLLAVMAVLAAVLLQVILLDNLPFPGGSPPDLVLVVVVTLALTSGPLEGALIGFGAGLAVDIAPPATHLLGQSALVFCLAGYGCGRLRGPLERSAWLPLAGVAAGVAGGEFLYALVGLTFGDPDITWHSIRQVLPAAIVYDLLLSPFVLYAVVRLGRYGEWAGARAPADLLTGRELRPAGVGLAFASGSVRDTGSGRGPRLKNAAGRHSGGWIGGGRRQSGQPAAAWVHRPNAAPLRLRGGVAGSAAGPNGQPGAAAPRRLMPTVNLRLGSSRRRDGVIGGSPHGVGGVARTAFGAPGGAPGRTGRGPARGPSFSGGQSALTQASQGRATRPVRLRFGSRHRGDGLVGGGALGNGKRPGAGRRAPGRGTFSGSSSVGTGAAAFLARRQPGATGPLRSGRGPGAAPRFRASLRGQGPAPRARNAGRGSGARPRFRGSGGGLLGRLRSRAGRAGRRSGVWRIGNRRMGGLP